MVNYAFVLVPLYIYPSPPTLWDPLFSAARSYPNTTFRAVINPDSGPGAGSCPDADYITALSELNSIPNIQTLAYVHTANRTSIADCDGICVCTRPISDLEADIKTYQNWPNCTANTTQDIHIDGMFFDEAPQTASPEFLDYMQQISSFAKETLTRGNTTLFNVGAMPDVGYWPLADYINVFEGTETELRNANLTSGVAGYASQATVIVQNYTSNETRLSNDVTALLGVNGGAGIAGFFASDSDLYNGFSTIWDWLVDDVDVVGSANV